MIIDTHTQNALKFSEVSQEFQSQSIVPERSYILGEHEQTIDDLLEDKTIVRRFAGGKKRLITNENLRINYAHNSLQLSTPTGDLIAIHKVAARLHYILVKKDNKYLELIQEIIGEYQFIPIDTATSGRGFMRYQKYEIPEGYNLRYAPVAEMWQTWKASRQQPHDGVQLDILILAKSKWYRVQEAICIDDDRLDVQTRLGSISLFLKDRIAWIAKLGKVPTINNVDLTAHHSGSMSSGDSEILGKIISKLAIESSPESDLQFNPYDTISESSFSHPQDADLLDDDRNSMLSANIVSPLKKSLRAAAIDVLEHYLEHGETIVKTEVVTDDRGNIVSEKRIVTQRGCPKWAIEAALSWK